MDDTNDIEAVFQEATSYVKEISSKLSEDHLLKFYGLYKQSLEGPCMKPKPSLFQVTEKQKWHAWSSLGNMERREAMRNYVELLNVVNDKWRTVTTDNSFEKSSAWVHHSCIKNNEEELKESDKTVFDWVKEGNFIKVVSSASSISDINELDQEGLSLLHWAADRGTLEIVKYLVENFKTNVNIKDMEGQTPLHYASFCGHEEIVKFLLKVGADVTIKDNDGQTPKDVASNATISLIFQSMNCF